MKTVENIEQLLVSIIKDICEINVDDKDLNLLSDEADITMADFLYVFDILEKQLDLPVVSILEHNDYTVFTVRNIASEIYKLQLNK